MSRRRASFTQCDVARVLRAAEQVIPGKWRVRVAPDGEILLEPADGAAPGATKPPVELGGYLDCGLPEAP